MQITSPGMLWRTNVHFVTYGKGLPTGRSSGVWALDELPAILVVEDEEPIQEFVKDALTDGGFDYVAIASGAEALALLKSGVVKYRALVTDINLKGGMSGWDVAKHVREIDPSFPVIYMTGAAADRWASHGVPNSILLQKPFAPAQLVTAISQLLNTGTATG